jgi:hypothetical protein
LGDVVKQYQVGEEEDPVAYYEDEPEGRIYGRRDEETERMATNMKLKDLKHRVRQLELDQQKQVEEFNKWAARLLGELQSKVEKLEISGDDLLERRIKALERRMGSVEDERIAIDARLNKLENKVDGAVTEAQLEDIRRRLKSRMLPGVYDDSPTGQLSPNSGTINVLSNAILLKEAEGRIVQAMMGHFSSSTIRGVVRALRGEDPEPFRSQVKLNQD